MLIDLVVPEPHFSEVHSLYVRGNAERALAAAREVTTREIRSLRPLWAVRVLPALFVGRRSFRFDRDRPVWDIAVDTGFVPVGETHAAAALGHVGQHWRPAGGEQPSFEGVEGFRAFSRPGFCKVVVDVRVAPHEDGVLLTTETRIAATDDVARERFGRYWMFIRPWSGLIRRGWLRAARRRTES